MTRILELVKKVDPDIWVIVGLMVVGLTATALAAYLYFTIIQVMVIFGVAVTLVWVSLGKIRWNRNPYINAPTRLKVTYIVFGYITLIATLITFGLIWASIENKEPFLTVITIVTAGIFVWFVFAIGIVALGYIPLMLARRKEEEQENHS